jgi:hypothetical protein
MPFWRSAMDFCRDRLLAIARLVPLLRGLFRNATAALFSPLAWSTRKVDRRAASWA